MEDPHRLGLVLEWVYGTIVSTAEKARDGAKRSLGESAPAVTLYHPCILLASWKLFCAGHWTCSKVSGCRVVQGSMYHVMQKASADTNIVWCRYQASHGPGSV